MFALTALATLCPTAALAAQTDNAQARDVSAFCLEDGVALNGYDPVGYFAEGSNEAVLGKASIGVVHDGVTYRFANREHRAYFEADPERYEPVFGGWCAWAMAFGKRVPADPRSYSVVGGHLFVFYDDAQRDQWIAELDRAVQSAKKHWAQQTAINENERLRKAFARRVSEYEVEEGAPALDWYDPVTFFPEGGSKPRRGNRKFPLVFRGVKYLFVNPANRARFIRNPDRYEPAYGGWCAYSLADGDCVAPNPKEYLITNRGRLLLFYTDWDRNLRTSWERVGEDELEPRADSLWGRRSGEIPRREPRRPRDAESGD